MHIAERVSGRRRSRFFYFLDRLRALGALVLLMVFVLFGGHRALEEEDEDE